MNQAYSREEVERFRRLDAAFRAGDMATLQAELGDLDGFPNVYAHPAIGACLTYAIYHGPITLVAALLDAGADPSWPESDGFPPLIAALTCAVPSPGTTVRSDVPELVELLLAAGARVDQHGVNGYTSLHFAAVNGELRVVDMLLAAGADPNETSRIDDYDTALDVATAAGHDAVVERLGPLTTNLG